jgi:F0F1-type ATP synthase membrane subunit c/vacuolar-type H+-ATPase subunit K
MRDLIKVKFFILLFFLAFFMLSYVHLVYGQSPDVSIAVTRRVIDDVVNAGDIIAYDPDKKEYRLAREGDENKELGVVVDSALLLFRTGDGEPVASSGVVSVQVSTLGGPIVPGDLIIPSQIPGKGMRAPSHITSGLGIAREALSFSTTSVETIAQDGEHLIAYGSIKVSLATTKFGAFEQTNEEAKGTVVEQKRLVGIALFAVFLARLIAAGIITGTALVFAYRMYDKHVVAGIESVGRNPLARNTIQGMVFANMALIAVISAAAIALSIMIVVLPI